MVEMVECTSSIKDKNGWLAVGENEVRRTWKDYSAERPRNMDEKEQVIAHMGGLCGVRRGNYNEREPIRNEVEAIVGKFRNGKAAVKNEVTGVSG